MSEPRVDAGPVPPAAEAEPTKATPNIGQVLFIALVVGAFAALWLVTYSTLNAAIWGNSFVASNRWTIPVGVVFFSLLVGLVEKYLHAPNMIEGGIVESLKAGDVDTYKTFWGTLLSSFFSLFSGASVGPEAPIGSLAVEVSEWLATKFKFAKQGALVVGMAGMSSAYNGLVGNPVFATLLASEVGGSKGGFAIVGPNLAAGTVGFLVFALLGIPSFAGFLNVGQTTGITVTSVAWAIALGLLGALLAVYIGIAVRSAGRIMAVFKDRVIERILVAAVIIAAVSYFIPDLMFSGEDQIHTIMANPAQYGVGTLLLFALCKPLLLALSLKSGYLGGPIFPSLFTAVMAGLALSLLLPGVPLSIIIPCLEAGVITLLLQAPLTSILLVAVVTMAGGNADMLGLITISTATSLIVGMVLRGLMARRNAPAQPAQSSASSGQ